MNDRQKILFFHQLATLLDSGLSVQQSLLLAGRELNSACQSYLQKVSAAVGVGQDLAAAMSQPPRYFDNWTINLIEVAQYSGALPEVCRRLADATQRRQRRGRLYRSIKLASIATIWSLFLLIVAVLHRNTTILALPGFWLLAVGLLALLIIGFNFFSSSSLAQNFQQLIGGLPIFGKIIQARSMLYFAELELPLTCGISIGTSLELLQKHIPDLVLGGKIASAQQRVLNGQPLSKSLQGRLPAIAIQMIRTGEETGNLDSAIQKVGQYYEAELERQLHQLKNILLPLSIIAVGGLIALVGIWAIASIINLLPG